MMHTLCFSQKLTEQQQKPPETTKTKNNNIKTHPKTTSQPKKNTQLKQD